MKPKGWTRASFKKGDVVLYKKADGTTEKLVIKETYPSQKRRKAKRKK